MANETVTGDLPELITVADVANYLGLTPQTVISFIKRGELVATKPPGMRGYRIPRQAFEDYRRGTFGSWPWATDAPVHARDRGRFARHASGEVERPPAPGGTSENRSTCRDQAGRG